MAEGPAQKVRVMALRFDERWIGPAQLALTAQLARFTSGMPGAVIEVGTWQGLSAIPIARAVAPAPLHVVDHWQGDQDAGVYGIQQELVLRDNYGVFLANLADARVTNVVVHKMGWQEFAQDWAEPVRFLHIDASHTADEVDGNIAALLPYAAPGAVFCGDDYGFPQVSEGVHRHFPDCHSSESKLWWKIIGDTEPGRAWPANSHPLTRSRAYMSSLSRIRDEEFTERHA